MQPGRLDEQSPARRVRPETPFVPVVDPARLRPPVGSPRQGAAWLRDTVISDLSHWPRRRGDVDSDADIAVARPADMRFVAAGQAIGFGVARLAQAECGVVDDEGGLLRLSSVPVNLIVTVCPAKVDAFRVFGL